MSYITAITGTMPSRTDNQENFSDNADALVAALPTLQSQINTVVDEINDSVDAVEADRVAVIALKGDVTTLKSDCETIKGLCEDAQDLAEDARDASEGFRDSALVIAAAAQSAVGIPSLTGKAGQSLTVKSAEDGVEWVQFAKPDSIVVLTSGTTWTCPEGVKLAYVRLVGGCGGGAVKSASSGGSGATGGEIEALVTLTPGTTYNYSVGAGGAESTILNTNGNSGGSTTITFGSDTFSVTGGSGGYTDITKMAEPGTVISCPSGLGKKGYPGHIPNINTVTKTYGGTSSLGTTGGGSNPNIGYAGDNGIIVLEVYK